MSHLVIVESPSKAGTVKNYLGSGYKVVASIGHVRDLPKSTLGVDIENGFKAKYINIRGKGPLIAELKKEAKNADKVYLAADPDREGEAISWHLVTALNIPPEKVCRVTFNEVTKSAVRDAIKHPRKIDEDLVNSQQARRILDRIVGYKLSPLFWKAIHGGLSAGRVQSVATRVIVDREAEINAFVPEEYWTIDADFGTAGGETLHTKYYGKGGTKGELHSESDVYAVLDGIKGGAFTVSSVRRSTRAKNPLPPFTTSTLQQDASRKLGFRSTRIMQVAQELYEGVNVGSENGGTQGLITYMRTDSLRVADEARARAAEYIESTYGKEYVPASPRAYKSKAGAQDAHEAIRPANPTLEPDKIKKYLTADQYKLYKLIFNRFTASQMASAELDTVIADVDCGGYTFRASGYTVRFRGCLAVYGSADEGENNGTQGAIPNISEGEHVGAEKITPARHFTEPPARYNEGSLVKFLEEKGIGRPSTYATIITTIISRGYVERDGKMLRPTKLGEVTTDLMKQYFPEIVDYEFTAQMESSLDDIEHGNVDIQSVLGSFYTEFAKQLETAEETVAKEKVKLPDEQTDIICDKCGATMIVKNGRYGKFAACPNYPACRNTRPLDRKAPASDSAATEKATPAPDGMKCEKCGADMVLRSGRYGSFYACSNYPQCKNTKQIAKKIGVKCPDCGGEIVAKHGRNRSYFYSCENYPKCKFSSWELPLADKCPQCGGMLFKNKGKNIAVCRTEGCGYKRELEPTHDGGDGAKDGESAK